MKSAMSVVALGLLAASVCVVGVGCAPSGAERFPGNPLFNPDYVPIAVGGQSLSHVQAYHEAGINLYMGIDDILENPTKDTQRKPSAEVLKVLGDLGMYTVAEQALWGPFKDSPIIIGWSCPIDEPDNRKDDDGKPVALDKFLAESRRIKAGDPTRPYFTCFGQGVINDGFRGRGISRMDYPRYMAAVDFIEYDFYPIANFKWRLSDEKKADPNALEPMRKDGEKHLDMVGRGVSRIRNWTGNSKPVLVWIETSHNHNPDPSRIAAPAQTACEVWAAMVHGARGVGYFSHDFSLPLSAGQSWTLARNKPMLAQLKITNGKLMKLAHVIAAPLVTEPDEAFCQDTGKVIFSTKKVDGATAVLSVNVLGEPAKATVPVFHLKKGAKIEVLEEGRTIEAIVDGSFTDTFAPYQEHIYRICDICD